MKKLSRVELSDYLRKQSQFVKDLERSTILFSLAGCVLFYSAAIKQYTNGVYVSDGMDNSVFVQNCLFVEA